MIIIKIIGLILCFGFLAFFIKLGQIASDVNNFCDSLPVGEGWSEEDESAADDCVQYRVFSDSKDNLPVELKQV